MEYIILTQSASIEDGNYTSVMRALEIDVILYQRGDWRPQGGASGCQVGGRFVVMQAMTREEEVEPDA